MKSPLLSEKYHMRIHQYLFKEYTEINLQASTENTMFTMIFAAVAVVLLNWSQTYRAVLTSSCICHCRSSTITISSFRWSIGLCIYYLVYVDGDLPSVLCLIGWHGKTSQNVSVNTLPGLSQVSYVHSIVTCSRYGAVPLPTMPFYGPCYCDCTKICHLTKRYDIIL